MRVLWLCNVPLAQGENGSGSWLPSMAQELCPLGVEIGVVSPARGAEASRSQSRGIPEWSIPAAPSGTDGLPPRAVVDQIITTVRTFRPELVHIWGTESYFGLLTARSIISLPAVVTIQGIKAAVAEHFFGGLSLAERVRCIGIREVARRNGLSAMRRQFARWSGYEREILAGHRHVICQAPWQAAQVNLARPDATVHYVELPLRREFEAVSWKGRSGGPLIFCSAGYPAPFKGLHTALRAFAQVKAQLPDARLRIAGLMPGGGIRRDGYLHWLESLAARLGLAESVEWLGRIGSPQMAEELASCSVALVPSYIESYCMAMAEAQRVGAPVVAAYTGGTAYLGQSETSCLFFPPGDVPMCSFQLLRALRNEKLSAELSRSGQEAALKRGVGIGAAQAKVYKSVLEGTPSLTMEAQV